jgi:cytochrome P450
VNQLIEAMQRTTTVKPDALLDMVKLYNCTTFDIMGDLTFGEPLGLLQQSAYTPWVAAVLGQIQVINIMTLTLEYPLIRHAARWLMPKKILEQQRTHFEHSVHRVNRRLARDTGENKSDIWSLVLTKGMDQLTLPKMHANASLFMVAGTETTATLLSGLTFYLLQNPATLQKLINEIRALRREELSLEHLSRLPYLNACFEEGLRLYPPVPIGFPREIAQGGNVICGEWVPEKVQYPPSWKTATTV